MKWIKLFENFSEENPSSIEIELTNELISKLNEWGVNVKFDKRLNLKHNNYYSGNYNMIKIGTSGSNYDIQNDYWVSYHPDINEIQLKRNITTKEDREYNYNHKHNEIVVGKSEPVGKILSGRFENVLFEKFENGFKVGEIGDGGYFKIVGVEK
jgi:hypothetical protein